MKKRHHLWLGGIFVLLFIIFLGWFNLDIITFTFSSVVWIILATAFYSILPDIDHKNSTITWSFFGIGVIGLVFCIIELFFQFNFLDPIRVLVFSTLLLTATYLCSNLFDHRGIIHTMQVGVLAVLPLWFLFGSFVYCLFGFAAWYSHLIGDGYVFKIR